MKRTPLKRSGRIRSRRTKPRPGRMTAAELDAERDRLYAKQKGLCITCHTWHPRHGDDFTRLHLSHKRGKRMWGDEPDNIIGMECYSCHIVERHNPKAVPPKVRS